MSLFDCQRVIRNEATATTAMGAMRFISCSRLVNDKLAQASLIQLIRTVVKTSQLLFHH
jgi:hypothetical protein